jgi:hypothetical protein
VSAVLGQCRAGKKRSGARWLGIEVRRARMTDDTDARTARAPTPQTLYVRQDVLDSRCEWAA